MEFRKFYIVCVCAFLVTGSVLAAIPTQAWTARYNGTANSADYAVDIAVDSAGNCCITGYARNTGADYDFVTIKYAPDGSAVWTKTYNRGGNYPDYAAAIAIDANSNVITAGFGYAATSGYDGIIVKYNSSGSQFWAKTYNYSGGSDDRFYDAAADANGNLYVVGRTNDDGLIVKYNSDGTVAWSKNFNGAANGSDYFYKLAIGSSGNVYACGESTGSGTDQDCLTVKYSPAGTLLWSKTYNGAANGWDLLEGIALDSAENVYVAGSVKTATDANYVTIKYSPDGNSLWTSFYNSPYNGWDEAYAITVTSDSNVVVTGYSDSASLSEAAIVKYNAQTGAQVWAKTYNGLGNSADYTEAIAADNSGSVYVCGRSAELGSTDYVTICYGADGTEKWKMNYNGPASGTDIGTAIAVRGSSVYVTGYSTGTTGNYDYATIKYTTLNCFAPPAGDLTGDCMVNFFDLAALGDGYVGNTSDRLTLKDIADTWLACGFEDPADCWN